MGDEEALNIWAQAAWTSPSNRKERLVVGTIELRNV